jgi:glycosyltransferase involved in cell wall biosynthesis
MPASASGLRVCVVGEMTGGVGVYGQNLLRGLAKLGVEATVITSTPGRSPAGRVIRSVRVRGRGRWIPQSLAFALMLRRMRHKFDLVHFTDARFAIFAPGGDCPLVGTMNDYFYAITGWFSPVGTKALYRDWVGRHVYYNVMRAGERFTLRRLERVVCISRAVREVLATRYGVARERLSVVPYGIEYGPVAAEPMSTGRPVVLFAGGNFQRKGLAILIRAAARIREAEPAVRFVIVGDSPDSALMRRLAIGTGVAEAFEFVGQVDHPTLYRYYRSSLVYAMPSILEAFGIPYLEAMHCGVPVVASAVAGPDDYLEPERNALVAPVGDASAVAEAIVRLLRDETLRKRLVAHGRETAARFTVERMARATLRAYLEAVSSARGQGQPPPGRGLLGQ